MELIVSIQGFSQTTTQELAEKAIENGASGIRTDQPIRIPGKIIGLKKNQEEFYISTDPDDIVSISKWAGAVAIDSRRGNSKLADLYIFARELGLFIVADVENIQDVDNILLICREKNIQVPEYIATTFSKRHRRYPDVMLLRCIRNQYSGQVIAEGGYGQDGMVMIAKHCGADAVCIGEGISDIGNKVKNYRSIIDG